MMWFSLDRRLLEKYYYKWQIQDWEVIEFPLLIATSVFACLMAKGLLQGLSKPDHGRSLDLDRLGWSLLIGNLIIVVATVTLIVFGRDYLGRNVKELGHIAVAQELLILLGLVLIAATAWRARNSDLRTVFGLRAAWLCGVLGFALFLLLMEEISWGQHFVGWGTPDAFNRNIQNETNLHNFYTNRFEFVYYSLAFVCFVLLPILAPQIRSQMLEPLKIFIPPASFGIAAIPVAGFMYENWGILIFQIYFLIGVCLAFLAATAMQGKARWSVVAVGLAMVFSQIVYLVYGHKLVSSYEIGEMRELSISFTLAAYSVWLLAETREITHRGQPGRAREEQLVDGMPNGGSASWARFVGWG
ncbi:hypothetical protein PZ897_15290 [Hoeflea sp. YIM 152468]|uniref:hypothetical protein n=1 Tax=Hoeflea sp. YIM 152468 TaxID=3031759 RepID=UPI0023DB5258|nr:hypothetical protein [Hoeflea sp. YIM 152468]MDF1609550.1 hypothetical protein [Hoeflea sp. YIM 152468]